MIERTLFDAGHAAFRDSFHRFVEKEIAPHHERCVPPFLRGRITIAAAAQQHDL